MYVWWGDTIVRLVWKYTCTFGEEIHTFGGEIHVYVWWENTRVRLVGKYTRLEGNTCTYVFRGDTQSSDGK